MPFFRDRNLDEQDQNGGSIQINSGGGNSPEPSGNPNQSGGGRSANTGSKFQNLDSYIRNNDARGFGEKFGQNVQNSIDQARNTIDTTSNEVRNQINGGANPATQEQINNAISSAGRDTTPDQASQYQNWLNQSYQGPMSLAENPGAQNKVEGGIRSANTKAQLAGTEAGRFSLLDQYFGRPSYNFGEKSLDNLLVERGGGFNNQKDLRDQAATLGAYGNQQARSIQDAASQRAGQFDQSKQLARSAISDAAQKINSDADNEVKSLNEGSAAALDAAKRFYSQRGFIDPALVDSLGLAGQAVYTGQSMSPDEIFKAGDVATRSNATSDLTARAKALAMMMGDDSFDTVGKGYLNELANAQGGYDGKYKIDDQAIKDAQTRLGEFENGKLLSAAEISDRIKKQNDLDAYWDQQYAGAQVVNHDQYGGKNFDYINQALASRNAARAELARLKEKMAYAQSRKTLAGTSENRGDALFPKNFGTTR